MVLFVGLVKPNENSVMIQGPSFILILVSCGDDESSLPGLILCISYRAV